MTQTGEKSPILLNRTPVSVITGYLGSGKTTLLNHLISQPGMDKTALIINEFGEVGLDHVLVESAIENTLLLENGCICCSIRGDLVDTICDLFAKVRAGDLPAFDRVLIETTGLADPGPIVRSIVTDEAVKNRCNLEAMITLVDGILGGEQISQGDETVVQIAHADLVLITKGDLCGTEKLDGLRAEVRQINPDAEITVIQHGKVDPDLLFQPWEHHTFPTEVETEIDPHEEHGHDHGHNHGHVQSISIVHDAPIDEDRFRAWLRSLYSLRAPGLLRLKGIVNFADANGPVLIQAVAGVFSPPARLETWPQGHPETHLVLIFKGLSAEDVERSFRANVLR